jgi:hypothetical protein
LAKKQKQTYRNTEKQIALKNKQDQEKVLQMKSAEVLKNVPKTLVSFTTIYRR